MNTNLHINCNYERNVTLDYLFSFLKNFQISSAIWVLYMAYKGLTLWEIGLVEGIYHISSFLFELPTGALADLFGRKNVMLMGRAAEVISCLLLLSAKGIPGFIIGFAFSALGYNLNSGSEEALVYDSMKAEKKEDGYIRVNARVNVIIEAAQGAATITGGILAQKSYVLCYGISVLITLLSLMPALLMKEPPIALEKEETKKKASIKEHFKQSALAIRENRQVINILLYYPTVAAFYTVLFFYGQQYYTEFGLNKVEISLLMFSSSAVSCIGELLSERILARWKEKTKYIAAIIMGIGIMLVSVEHIVLSILAFEAASFVNALLEPIESASLNERIPSEQRATILSVNSMCFSMAMIVFFPLCGVAATVWNLHITFLLLGMVEAAMVALLIKRRE